MTIRPESVRFRQLMTRPPELFGREHLDIAVATCVVASPGECVVISTAQFDGRSGPRQSNCSVLRRVGPEHASEYQFTASVVIIDAVDEDQIARSDDVTEAIHRRVCW